MSRRSRNLRPAGSALAFEPEPAAMGGPTVADLASLADPTSTLPPAPPDAFTETLKNIDDLTAVLEEVSSIGPPPVPESTPRLTRTLCRVAGPGSFTFLGRLYPAGSLVEAEDRDIARHTSLLVPVASAAE